MIPTWWVLVRGCWPHQHSSTHFREKTPKMNAKQAEIDVAVSERNTLAEKAEAVKSACKEAQENFEQLQAAHQAKVSGAHCRLTKSRQ